jgi:glycerol uptake facilitator-like aquaporin
MKPNLPARIVAELLGTAFLVAAVVGSGIMAERLSGGMSRWRFSPTPSQPVRHWSH